MGDFNGVVTLEILWLKGRGGSVVVRALRRFVIDFLWWSLST